MTVHPRTACFVLLFLGLILPAPVAAQEPAPTDAGRATGPALEAQATAAVTALEAGLKSKAPGERRAAVLNAAGIAHPNVAKALGKAAGDKDSSVRVAAFDTLGTLGIGEALAELHRAAKSAKPMKDDPAALVALYRGIGRYGDKSSIEVLMADPWITMDNTVVKARVYALGNVRQRASVDGLLSLMNLGNPPPGEDSAFMSHFRVALTRLTGTDQGTNKSLWQKWGRDNKAFVVSADPAPMPAELQGPWDEFWGVAAGPAPATRAGQSGPGAEGQPEEPGGER